MNDQSQSTKPRIAILYHYMYPDDVISACHFDGLAASLARSGWDVEALPCNRGCGMRLRYLNLTKYTRSEIPAGLAASSTSSLVRRAVVEFVLDDGRLDPCGVSSWEEAASHRDCWNGSDFQRISVSSSFTFRPDIKSCTGASIYTPKPQSQTGCCAQLTS